MTNPLIAKYEELYGKKEEPKAELVELSQEQSDILNKYLQNTNLPYAPPQSVATSNTGITAVNPSQTFTSKELEKTKSPVEKAYKDSYGFYPITDGMSGGDWHYLSWDAFQKGYNAAYEEKVVEEPEEPDYYDEVEWDEKDNPNENPLDCFKRQTPEQVADGLKEAFREAVKQGVVSSVDKPKDDFMDRMVAELKGQSLTDLIHDWWSDVFTHSDWDKKTCIENLVDEISLWLPTEHETNSYKWNECIRTIREKLR